MADDQGNSLIIDIQFDDGSVQKGFVKLAQLSKDTSKKVEDDFKGTKLIDFEAFAAEGTHAVFGISQEFIKFGIAVAGAAVVMEGFKKGLELALEGEHINALNAQFEVLTKQAGISTETLRHGLEEAAAGLVDADELLKVANASIINLGASAARLPEILELSRKVTALLGGDMEERFQSIAGAIETGNQKALKSAGIIIDVDKAYRAYAQTLNLNTSELNKSQQQQAVLNAVLEEGGKKFANVSTSIQPATDSLTRFKVAMKEIVDETAKGIAKSGAFNQFTTFLEFIAQGGISPEDKINKLKFELFELQGQLEKFSKLKGSDSARAIVEQDIANVQAKLEKLQAASKATQVAAEAVKSAESASAPSSVKDPGAIDNNQAAFIRLRGLEVQEALKGQALAENQIEQSKTDFIFDQSEKRAAIQDILGRRIELVREQYAIKERELYEQQAAGQIQTADQLRSKLIAIKTQERTEIEKLENDKAKSSQTYIKALADQQQRVAVITAGIQNIIRTTVHNIAEQLVQGSFSFEDFGKAVGLVFADMLIQVGDTLILQGLAIEAFITAITALLPGSGAAAAAAGVGLVLFGTALKAALGGGGKGSSYASSSSGGGASSGGGVGYSGSTPTTQVVQPAELERAKANTTINLNVNGSIFDSADTGLRLVNIINENFDKTGVKVQQAAVG